MLERRSALASVLARSGHDGPQSARGVRMGEARGLTLVQVAGWRDTVSQIEVEVTRITGVPVPASAARASRHGSVTLLRTGPEQLWVLTPTDNHPLATHLAEAIGPALGVVTPLSHSRTRIVLDGPEARRTLAKAIPLDLENAEFPVEATAMTGIHHTPVLLLRTGPERYEVLAMRTFALAVWEWLEDCAREYGVEIVTGEI